MAASGASGCCGGDPGRAMICASVGEVGLSIEGAPAALPAGLFVLIVAAPGICAVPGSGFGTAASAAVPC